MGERCCWEGSGEITEKTQEIVFSVSFKTNGFEDVE
jgi:hypothetical protein